MPDKTAGFNFSLNPAPASSIAAAQGRSTWSRIRGNADSTNCRVLHGAIHIGNKRVEPHDLRRESRIGGISRCEVEHRGARKIVEREVQADARTKKVADFFIGLVPSEGGIDLDQDKFGDIQTQSASDFAGNQLSHQREGALPRTSELQYVKAEVVGFDNGRERATLPERCHISGRAYCTKHCSDSVPHPVRPSAVRKACN